MGRDKVITYQITSILLLILVLCRFSWQVQCQILSGLNQTSDHELHPLLVEFNRTSNPELLPLVTKLIYKRLSNLTSIYQGEVSHDLAFCIKDQKEDWNAAFNFTTDLEFLSTCIKRTKGDITQRLCTAAEIKFYFRRYFATNYLKPNENCNLTTWNPAVNLDGLIPLAIPHTQLNHTCGGADSWADVRSTGEMFCSVGSYCPSTIKKIPCSDGHYFRKGSRSENKCFKLTSCKLNTATQGIHLYGVILIAGLSALLIIISDQETPDPGRLQQGVLNMRVKGERPQETLPRSMHLDCKDHYHINFLVKRVTVLDNPMIS
ncbi:hypothetical protein MKW92_010461 [Papaver armeniacum]|nr:hypothetical protein MKW92_010461 [Papaver armeniacum]